MATCNAAGWNMGSCAFDGTPATPSTLLAFNCKRRGFCPSCGARRMVDGAAWLVDQVLPERPIRQWVLSLPFPLRFLLATHPALIGRVLGIVYRVIAGHLIRQAGYAQQSARTGAVTLIQRFGSALNLNIHFHMLFLDGVRRLLEREGLPERDTGQLDPGEAPDTGDPWADISRHAQTLPDPECLRATR